MKRAFQRRAYKVSEVAELLPLGESTIAKLVAAGIIPSTRVGGSRLISEETLNSLLQPEGGDGAEVPQ